MVKLNLSEDERDRLSFLKEAETQKVLYQLLDKLLQKQKDKLLSIRSSDKDKLCNAKAELEGAESLISHLKQVQF